MRSRALHGRLLSAFMVFLFTFAVVPFSGTTAIAEGTTQANEVEALTFGPQSVRVQGVNRLATSVAISQEGWETSDWVVIATARNFPDALVAGPLAAALAAPVLLSETDALPADVAAEVTRLGASNAILIGGAGALSENVAQGLREAGIPGGNIERIGGHDRYQTARLVALRLESVLGRCEGAALATGRNFPDALAVSGFAGAKGMPILLTKPASLHPDAEAAFEQLDTIETLVVGGEGAVSSAVETLAPHPRRIGGVDRYDTARAIAEYSFAYGFSYSTIIVAVGTAYPDALCAGPWAAVQEAPVILTRGDRLSGPADEFFNMHCSSIEDIVVVGGEGAIGGTVVTAIEEAATTMLNPALVSMSADDASDIETVAPDGSQVVFPVGSAIAASIEESSVLMSGPSAATPSGMLLRVTSVEEVGGKIIAHTEQATLDDVIFKGSLDVTGTLDPNAQGGVATDVVIADTQSVGDTHVDVTFDEVERNAGVPTEIIDDPSAAGAAAAAGVEPQAGIGGSVTIPFEAEVGPGGEDKAVNAGVETAITAEGSITFSGEFTVNASWGYLYWQSEWWGGYPVYGLQNITLQTYLAEVFQIDLAYEQSASLTLDIIEMIGKRLNRDMRLHVGRNVAWVGAVPVITEFYLAPIVELSGSVGGKLGVSYIQGSSLTAGIRYDYGVGWRPIRGSSNWFGFRFDTGVTASVDVALGAQLECLLYGIAGPYFGVTGNLGVDVDTTEDNWWWAYAAVKGRFGGKVDLFGQSTTLWQGELVFWQRRIVQADGPFPSTGTQWWPSSAAAAQAMAAEQAALESVDLHLTGLTEPAGVAPMEALSTPIDASTVQASDFEIPGLTITAATVLPDGKTVRLTTSKQARGADYIARLKHEAFRTTGDAWAASSADAFVGYYPPSVTWAAANADNTVEVHFDSYRGLVADTVAAADFSIPGVTVTGATLQADGRTVLLDTSAQSPGARLTVSCAAGKVGDGFFTNVSSADEFTGFADYARAATSISAPNSVFEMRSPDGVTCYAVGMDGRVEKTSNGGATWQYLGMKIAPSVAMNTGVGNSYDIAFPGGDPTKIVVPVYLGVIARSVNGGSTFQYFDNDAVTTRHGINLDFNDATHGIATVGGQLLETNDAGVTWARHAQDGSVSGVNVRFADENVGYLVGGGGVAYRTDDGGATWVATSATGTTATLNKIAVSPEDSDVVIVVGADGAIVRSEDSGASWTACDSGTARGLTEVQFGDADTVFACGVESVTIVSRDSGRTWTVLNAGSAGAPYMSGMWARDSLNVWTAGLGGAAFKITGN